MGIAYDIGMHDGADSRHYLQMGYRVVAVEANPDLCALCADSFAREIAEGRLRILNVAIADSAGKREFWVCDRQTVWSSLDRSIASRDGAAARAITVECMRLDDIIREFGVGEYAKIDIEGADGIAVGQLTRGIAPAFISVELDHRNAAAQLEQLRALGYDRFKLICQNLGWLAMSARTLPLLRRAPRSVLGGTVSRGVTLARQLQWRLRGMRLRRSASGPAGPLTDGRWIGFDATTALADTVVRLDARAGTAGLGWWFDIHACRGGAPGASRSGRRVADGVS